MDELPELEQLRMMEKLLGRDNAKRFQGSTEKGERFRYRRPNHTAQYFRVQKDIWPFTSWTVEVFENGRTTMKSSGLTEESCQRIVKALRGKGIPTRRLILEADRQTPPKNCQSSRRKEILERLRGFQA